MSTLINRVTNRTLMDKLFNSKDPVNQPGTSEQHIYYCIIRNIPQNMRSKDLRRYFSDYTENGKFHCFHFRHRPERREESNSISSSAKSNGNMESSTTCCVISFKDDQLRCDFIKDYHGRHWMNAEGMEIPRRCFVTPVKVVKSSEVGASDYLTDADIKDLVELKPPQLMPKGNVGTPSEYFLEQIRLCRFPASMIPKLGLQSARRRRKFGSVPFNYGTEVNIGIGKEYDDSLRREQFTRKLEEEKLSIQDQSYSSDPTEKVLQQEFGPDNDAFSDKDDDQCEEWERHEALHDDVTEQDRTKPRKYEEEMEVIWEKGGPGLVWYTDKNYWDEREKGTDCDWAWADDWDVDYSVYYEGKSAGTKDGRDAVEIREDENKRNGKLEQSVFMEKKEYKTLGRKRRRSGSDVIDIEKFSKRIGSKLLGRMGWHPGAGLGKSNQGRLLPVALHLEEDGQTGTEKKGFGYRGEKMQRFGFEKKPLKISIASSFDRSLDQNTVDKKNCDNLSKEVLFRRPETTKMKYRNT